MSSRIGELTSWDVYRRPLRPVVPDIVEDLVGGNLIIRLSYIGPKAIEVERLRVVLVG